MAENFSADIFTLSKRELEVIRLLVKGYGNKEIAMELGLSIDTIKTHLKSIFLKLQVKGRTQAAVKVVESGFLLG